MKVYSFGNIFHVVVYTLQLKLHYVFVSMPLKINIYIYYKTIKYVLRIIGVKLFSNKYGTSCIGFASNV